MGKLREYIESAIKIIRSNTLRTVLTMLGIIIGIASVIAIITLGNGMKAYVATEINSIGGNMASVYLDSSKTTATFTQSDADALIEDFPSLIGTSFDIGYDGMASARKGSRDALVLGVSPAYEYSSGNGLLKGRYFNRDELDSREAVCILMSNDAKKLFGTADAIGMTAELEINDHIREFEVIGIRKDYGDMIMKLLEFEDYPLIIEIPYTTMSDTFAISADYITSIDIYMRPDEHPDTLHKIVKYLEVLKGIRGQDAIFYYSMNDDSDQIDSILGLVTTFITLVAAISLIVGGIGVMNIMLVSVTERTREIGIRKSIGARTSSIMMQFLAESSIISLTGGIIGIILGILIAAIACHLLHFVLSISLSSVVIATLFSTLIGLFFGIYPARKAAKLKPIDALSAH